MKLSLVIAALRARCPMFAGNVAGAAEFKAPRFSRLKHLSHVVFTRCHAPAIATGLAFVVALFVTSPGHRKAGRG
jgi:hypothetical protein